MPDNHHTHALQAKAHLQEFEIVDVLGSGGFGITYRAVDTTLSTEKQKIWVAIKEYFPRDHVLREHGRATVVPHSPKDKTFYDYGFKSFQEEARTLARFPEHPNIVQIKRYFTANGTAYMVMPYLEGQTFGQWLAANPRPSQQQLLDIFIPVLDGLRAVHAENYLHRDLKPGNIYLRSDGRPLLIDFGAARLALGEHSKSLSVVLSEGYAAKEQYSKRGNQGEWTDIYAIGATLWRAIAGCDPEPATDRSEARDDGLPDPLRPAVEVGRGRYTVGFLKAIDWALAYLPQDRPQTVKAFQEVLLREWQGSVPAPPPQPVPAPQPAPIPRPTPQPSPRPAVPPIPGVVLPLPDDGVISRIPKWSVLAAGVVVLAGGGFWLGNTGKSSSESAPVVVAVPEPIVAPTPVPPVPVAPSRAAYEPEMADIPAGKFTMGCDPKRDDVEGGCFDGEKPAHEVSISAFQMAKTEVTVAQFREFVKLADYKTTAEIQGSCWSWVDGWKEVKGNSWHKLGFEQGDDHPVACVSWDDAQAYVKWLKQKTQKDYRLPSEAEWEYAARGGKNTAYPWGNAIGKNQANCVKDLCGDKFDYTSSVGGFAANPFGLVDMHGNVWEWVQDWKGDYAAEPQQDPQGASDGTHRVLRGGSWDDLPVGVRSAYRGSSTPGNRDYDVGFRVAQGR